MTTTKNNEHKKLNFSNEREQSQACLNSAEHEKNQGRKVLNVPNLRFPEFQGEWEETKIGDIAIVVGGGTPDTNTSQYWNGKIQWFTPSEIGRNKYVYNSVRTISEDGLNKSSAKLLPIGTILLSSRATVGECSINKKECTTNQGFQSLIPKENISNEFVYYLIQTKRKDLIRKSCGSTFLEISANEVRKIVVSIPTIKEQDKIAKLLSLLDERIATQNKIIEDLKKLKAAIIEIEYTPNTKTTSPIGDVIEQISKRNKNNAIKNVLSVSNRQGFIKQSDQFENRNIASEDTSNYKIVEQNDFAFNPARINVGSIARLTTFEKGIVSPMYICFRTQGNVVPEYIDYYFESKHFYCEIQKRLEGSVRQCLSFEGLCNIPLSLPSFEMQQLIGKRLFTLGQKIRMETDLLELLNKQKQYLLRQMFI